MCGYGRIPIPIDLASWQSLTLYVMYGGRYQWKWSVGQHERRKGPKPTTKMLDQDVMESNSRKHTHINK
jgi:hypothetical protein